MKPAQSRTLHLIDMSCGVRWLHQQTIDAQCISRRLMLTTSQGHLVAVCRTAHPGEPARPGIVLVNEAEFCKYDYLPASCQLQHLLCRHFTEV